MLGLAGALGGVMGISVSSLYCEAELLCDVERMHRLSLSDQALAAHLLVLWNIVPDHEHALAAIQGTGESVATRSEILLKDTVGPIGEEPLTKREAVMLAWRLRGAINEVSEAAPGSARGRDVIFPRSRVKEVMARVEDQLGVA